MVQLATRHKSPASKVQALNRKALIQMRQGELKAAIDSAVAAAKIARQSRRKPLLATSLLSLGEVQVRAGQYEVALKIAQQAVELFEAAGESSSAGRAHWVSAMACQRLGRNKQSRAAAQSALELCTQAADRYGIGNALVLLSQSDPDIAASVRHLRQATQAFEAAGYVERRMVALGNLATKYDELRLRAIAAQREALHRLRAQGKIGGEAFRRIQEELDWSELDAAPAGSFQSLAS